MRAVLNTMKNILDFVWAVEWRVSFCLTIDLECNQPSTHLHGHWSALTKHRNFVAKSNTNFKEQKSRCTNAIGQSHINNIQEAYW